MPYYLIQTAYTSESWEKMIKSPQDRIDAVRPSIAGRTSSTRSCGFSIIFSQDPGV